MSSAKWLAFTFELGGRLHSPNSELRNHDSVLVEGRLHEVTKCVVVFEILDGREPPNPEAR
jgi:hypothetical protein